MAEAVLLYDHDCGFCRTCTAAVLAWDRRRALRPIALQDPEVDLLLADMRDEERMESWHLVSAGGRVTSAGAAFAPLMSLLPAGAPLVWLAERFPEAVERGYRWVAGRRTPLGRALPERAKRWADGLIGARSAG